MLLVLTLLVRDKEDILEANLDFHFSMGVDFAIVTDHRSVDGTAQILSRYQRAGRVWVIREDAPTYEQARWVTRMARLAFDLGASWMINSDADEFWWPAQADLRQTLESVHRQYDVVSVPRTDYLPVLDVSAGPFWRRMTYREVESTNLLGQPLPGKVCHRARPDIAVAQGNHFVGADNLGATLDDGRIEILHFPMRTYEQFERKIVHGGRAYEAPGSPIGVGETWRRAYSLWQNGLLRDVYDARVLTDEIVTDRLRSGAIVRDERLERLLESVTPLVS